MVQSQLYKGEAEIRAAIAVHLGALVHEMQEVRVVPKTGGMGVVGTIESYILQGEI